MNTFDYLEKTPVDTETTLFRPLMEHMEVALQINEVGCLTIVHDKVLPFAPAWLEYAEDSRRLYLMSVRGQIQDLGITMNDEIDWRLKQLKMGYVVWMEDKETIGLMYSLPLNIQRLN